MTCRTELKVGQWLEGKTFRAVFGVVHVVRG